MTDAELDGIGGQLPPGAGVLASVPLFLENKRLLLVGKDPRPRVAEAPSRRR